MRASHTAAFRQSLSSRGQYIPAMSQNPTGSAEWSHADIRFPLEVPGISAISSNNFGIAAYHKASKEVYSALERLSTGKKINRAADDPSGFIAVTQLKVRSKELHTKIDVIDQQIAGQGALDGGVATLNEQVLSLQSLVLQSANTGAITKDEVNANQIQVNAILDSIDYLSNTTFFKGNQILSGENTNTLGSWNITITDKDGNQTTKSVSLKDLREGGLLSLSGDHLDAAQDVVKAAVSALTTQRAGIGNNIRTLQSNQRLALSELESTEQARSDLEDTDFAAEASNLIHGQTQQQAAIFVAHYFDQQRAEQTLALLKPLANSAA